MVYSRYFVISLYHRHDDEPMLIDPKGVIKPNGSKPKSKGEGEGLRQTSLPLTIKGGVGGKRVLFGRLIKRSV